MHPWTRLLTYVDVHPRARLGTHCDANPGPRVVVYGGTRTCARVLTSVEAYFCWTALLAGLGSACCAALFFGGNVRRLSPLFQGVWVYPLGGPVAQPVHLGVLFFEVSHRVSAALAALRHIFAIPFAHEETKGLYPRWGSNPRPWVY